MVPDAPLTPKDIEPLERIARFSWDWAPALCAPGDGCADYHRAWSMLRLVLAQGKPPAGWRFFHAEIARAAAQGARRVLISGGADTGVLSIVASGFRNAGVAPQITYVDRCATPVMQNRLLGAELGLDLTARTADMLDFRAEGMDLVIAHSFLVFFPRDQRGRVVANWAASLVPGGAVLMSSALAEDGEGEPWRPEGADDIPARQARLTEQARAAGLAPVEVAELAEVAGRFWASRPTRRTGPLGEAEMRGLFAAAGLTVERVDHTGKSTDLANGTGTLRRRRAAIIARKPA
ncbi:class I SAM-dependent methyltransferase [Rhodovulum tesquicola]|uniref:class I SAM-dependent methyltransferase n=1 Tax=Rhodovulum tesquicola TaxID=540254 RepID=UPI002097AAE8|nr:class I SAM-dependent methyltransferase [Rhodovulum tesquicola]MCO8143963.1 class I SAM-dependent methyltransferase [Rhodovulum tesquicola]